MKRIAYTALASGLAMAVAAPAAAAPFLTIDSGSGSFGNPQITCTGTAPCAFSDMLTFTTPAGFNLASLTISSSIVGGDPATDVNFNAVTLNGVAFNTILTGATEFRNLLNQALTTGATNTLVISGMTGTNGSYGGSVSFAPGAPAVPEAATWAMMIGGVGAVGVVLRRRKATVAVA